MVGTVNKEKEEESEEYISRWPIIKMNQAICCEPMFQVKSYEDGTMFLNFEGKIGSPVT